MADEHRMAFYNNRPRRCDFGTYGLRRDGPVPYQCFLPSFFDKPAPKSNSPCLATFTRQRVARSLCGSTILKNRSDRACRVVHWSPCRMFHASLRTIQSKKFCGDFQFLVISYLHAVHGDDVIMPQAIVIFPQTRYQLLHNSDRL